MSSNTEIEVIDTCIWKLKKNLYGKPFWKGKWVFCNGELFFQWKNKTQPKPEEKANNVLNLKFCDYELTGKSKFSFKIIDKSQKKFKEYHFAVMSEDDLIKWWKLLLGSSYNDITYKAERSVFIHRDYPIDTGTSDEKDETDNITNRENVPDNGFNIHAKVEDTNDKNSMKEKQKHQELENTEDDAFDSEFDEDSFPDEEIEFPDEEDEDDEDFCDDKKHEDDDSYELNKNGGLNPSINDEISMEQDASDDDISIPPPPPDEDFDESYLDDESLHKPAKKSVNHRALEFDLLKLSTSMVFNSSWKSKKVLIDSDSFQQYQATNISTSEKPKYSFTMNSSKVTDSTHLQQYAFKIHDLVQDIQVIYAANSETDLLLILNKCHVAGASVGRFDVLRINELGKRAKAPPLPLRRRNQIAKQSITKSSISSTIVSEAPMSISIPPDVTSDFLASPDDLILDFFETARSELEDAKVLAIVDIKISFLQLAQLLRKLSIYSSDYINPNAASLIYADLGLSVDDRVSYQQFRNWWDDYVKSYRFIKTAEQNHKHFMRSKALDNILWSTELYWQYLADPLDQITHFQSLTHRIRLMLLFCKVPKFTDMQPHPSMKPSPEDDWNSVFQLAMTRIVRTGNIQSESPSNDVLDNSSSKMYARCQFKLNSLSRELPSSLASSPESSSSSKYWKPLSDDAKPIDNFIHLCSLLASFYQTANTGTDLIMREFLLPDRLKSPNILRIPIMTQDMSVEESHELGDVYAFDGLIFRIVDRPHLSHADSTTITSRPAIHHIDDEVKRKLVLQEVLGRVCLQDANIQLLNQRLPHKSLLQVSYMLSTIIDSCGFRVFIICPVETGKQSLSLSYGHELTHMNPLNGTHFRSRKFINKLSLKEEMQLLKWKDSISLQLNFPIEFNRQSQVIDKKIKSSKEVVLETELQLHRSKDDHFYLLNTSSILPLDNFFKKKETIMTSRSIHSLNQIYSKRLRHEYILRKVAESLNLNNLDDDSEVDQVDDSINSTSLEDITLKEEALIHCSLHLDELDNIAWDSFMLTSFLHSHGVNCRYIGKIYQYSRSMFIQQILLIEMIARSFTCLLQRSLRSLLDSTKRRVHEIWLESKLSEDQTPLSIPRSRVNISFDTNVNANKEITEDVHEQDYFIKAQQAYQQDKADMIWNLLQLLFHSHHPKSPSFWKNALSACCHDKFQFSINLDDKRRALSISAPQLLLAVKYHSGLEFQDIPIDLNRLTQDHIVNYNPMLTKFHILYPKEICDVIPLVDGLVLAGMSNDALSLLKMQLVIINTTLQHVSCPKALSHRASITYRYCLALFHNQQLEECMNVIIDSLEVYNKYSIESIRIHQILINVLFQLGYYKQSMECFQESFHILNYLYSQTQPQYSHPIVFQHIINFADLFCSYIDFTKDYLQQGIHLFTSFYDKTSLIYETSYPTSIYKYDSSYWYHILLGNRLGRLLLKESLFSESIEELEEVYSKLCEYKNAILISSTSKIFIPLSKIQKELQSCLYCLILSYNKLQSIDKTYVYVKRYLELIQETECIDIDEGIQIRGALSHLFLETIDVKKIHADMLLIRGQGDIAINILQEIFQVIKMKPNSFPNVSTYLADLTSQLVNIIHSMHSLVIRKYMENVALSISSHVDENELDIEEIQRYSPVTMNSLWSDLENGKQFYLGLYQKVAKYSFDGNIDIRRVDEELKVNCFQITIIMKMLK